MKFNLKPLPAGASKIWLGVPVVLLLVIIAILVGRFMLGKQGRVDQALLDGQRVEISLMTGEIAGKIREQATTKTAEEKGKKEAEEKLALLEDGEDFIGPRMPKREVAKIQKVSLAELGDKPVVVVIVKGLGLSASTTETALELPPEITLGFSPYSPFIQNWAQRALADGHEIILNIPMETRDYKVDDPGPYALLTSSSKDDNITRLKMLLSLVDGYRAIYSEKGEMFTQSIGSVKPILSTLKEQNTYFIYGGGYADFSLIQVADGLNYPLLVSDVIIDEEITSEGINEKLATVEKIAKEKGYAVAMAHPYPISVRMLERWLPRAEKNGIKVVPVSLLLGKSFQ